MNKGKDNGISYRRMLIRETSWDGCLWMRAGEGVEERGEG
jgi:hypothetical protein